MDKKLSRGTENITMSFRSTSYLGQWFSNCVLKSTQGSPLGCHHDGKDAFGRFQAPIPASLLHCFTQNSFTFTLGFCTFFIQRASWLQSLWKTNDLRISCSQNAWCIKRPFLESDWSLVRCCLVKGFLGRISYICVKSSGSWVIPKKMLWGVHCASVLIPMGQNICLLIQ